MKLNDLFDAPGGTVLADWFTGRLHASRGKLVEYVHMGDASRFERYEVFDFESGVLVQSGLIGPDEYEADLKVSQATSEIKKQPWWRFWPASHLIR